MIYVFLANGFEEIEALSPVDCLRRCGLTVKTVGVGGMVVQGSHGIPVVADLTEDEVVLNEDVQAIVLPGGMPGTLNLEASTIVQTAIDYCSTHHIYLAAICAAPSILGHLGLLAGKEATCYEGFETQLSGAILKPDAVCVSDHIITARSAGVAQQFSFRLAALLAGQEKADHLRDSMMCEA